MVERIPESSKKEVAIPEGYEVVPESMWPSGWKKEMGLWIGPTQATVEKALAEGDRMILERQEALKEKLPRGDSEMLTVIVNSDF